MKLFIVVIHACFDGHLCRTYLNFPTMLECEKMAHSLDKKIPSVGVFECYPLVPTHFSSTWCFKCRKKILTKACLKLKGKLNQTVLELDFRAVKFLFFPRRDLNTHH